MSEFRWLVVAILSVVLLPSLKVEKAPLEINVAELTINGVSLGLERNELEREVLGGPTFEKMTDLATYGLDYDVSVMYDGSEQSSYAIAVHGDALLHGDTAVLEAGQSLEDARRVLGSSLLGVQRRDCRDAYPIKGTNSCIVTNSGSHIIRSFDAQYDSGPCLTR